MADQPQADLYPVKLRREGDDRLVITWSDGVEHVLSWSLLRRQCPCAACRQERAKPPTTLTVLTPEQAQPARPKAVQPVGRYAYQIEWTDGHTGGIYTFRYLRQLGEQNPSLGNGLASGER